MRTCDACGFENAEPGKPCALCGASEIVSPTMVTDDVPTLAMPAGRAPAEGAASAIGQRAVAATHGLSSRFSKWISGRKD